MRSVRHSYFGRPTRIKDPDKRPLVELTPAAKKRLRELAGARVPVVEIAAVLRIEFKVEVTWQDLDKQYADEILVGRAYVMERVSKKTVASALDGSATAQRVMFDVARDADQRDARNDSGKGRQVREIRLTVLRPEPATPKGEPASEENSPATGPGSGEATGATPGQHGEEGRADEPAERPEAGRPEAPGYDVASVHAEVGRGPDAPRKVQRGMVWERFMQVPLVRDDGCS